MPPHLKSILPFDLFEKYLGPFSAHAVEYKGVLYPTFEHAYHCQRYSDPKILEEIRSARSPYQAWVVSQKYKSQQFPDFEEKKVAIVEELFRAKMQQHSDIRDLLHAYPDVLIIKNFPDPVWGIGMNGVGENHMGRIWMKLRAELLAPSA